MLTQIRSAVGETTFWTTLRKVLSDFALGSVTTEQFLAEFAPNLDAGTLSAIRTALVAKGAPTMVALATDGGISLTLSDTYQTLIVPVQVTTISASGEAVVRDIPKGTATTLSIAPGGYLAIDERDIHPVGGWLDVPNTTGIRDFFQALVPGTMAGGADDAFFSRSASNQETALYAWGVPYVATASTLQPSLDKLDSSLAKRGVLSSSCMLAATDASWNAALATALLSPSAQAIDASDYGSCGGTLIDPARAELQQLIEGGITGNNSERFLHLINFDYGAAQTLSLLTAALAKAPTLLIRTSIIRRLRNHVVTRGGRYSSIPAGELAAWTAFFRSQLPTVTTISRLSLVFSAITNLKDKGALPAVGARLQVINPSYSSFASFICGAWRLAGNAQNDDWRAFVTALGSSESFSAPVKALVNDPTSCK